ncbi:hypothetical protein [Bradyrhizobium japonicum]|uniref:hypothetical protein n=1 Tax=Bradyrhizobium japonicum TaxID=375 RepID=UPI0006519681|nr:hypothetical protein [Bradyrhizobium japonicum]KMJ98134.1 hypothetical protein CF64_17805 [Bradyrhizobium japonicum]
MIPTKQLGVSMGVYGFDLSKGTAVALTTAARRPRHRQFAFRGLGLFDIADGSRACDRAGRLMVVLITCFLPVLTGTADAKSQDDGDRGAAYITPAMLDQCRCTRGPEQIDGIKQRLKLAQRADEVRPAATQPAGSRLAAPGSRGARTATEQARAAADAPAQEMTSTPPSASNAAQAASETERLNQNLLLDQERQRANKLARELAAARVELDAARQTQTHTVRAMEIGIQQTQALEQEREKTDNLSREISFLKAELDVARVAASKAMQAPEPEPKQERPVDRRNGAKRFALQLASLRSDLEASRSAASEATKSAAAEAAQRQALERELKQEQDKTEALISELGPLRIAASETARVGTADVDQKLTLMRELEKQRGRAESADRQLQSLQAELRAAQTASSELGAARAADAEQKLALKREVEKQRDRAESADRQLQPLQVELRAAKTASSELAAARAADAEQKLALKREVEKQRDRAESADRQLQPLQAELRTAQTASSELAAARAADAEQKLALKREVEQQRGRADALAREAASLKDQRDLARAEASEAARVAEAAAKATTKREKERPGSGAAMLPTFASVRDHLAAWNASTVVATPSREPTGRAPSQSSLQPAASPRPAPSTSAPIPPSAQVTKGTAMPGADSKAVASVERQVAASGAPRPLANEERLLARASALLRQSDINGARGLLEYVLGHGSAQAAFMLAETYDPRVLQTWDARGVAGDSAKARELYERAQVGGVRDAEARIKGLR